MSQPLASLSLDLDNKWSYLKTHGDAGWEQYPTYLPVVIPRVLELLVERNWKITFFVVGQDAVIDGNQSALASLSAAGHEIGNHSFKHEPWLHLYSPDEIDAEIAAAETAIQRATGRKPIGFRGPGFSFSAEVHRTLAARGYKYDASTFPTFIGPLARMYYFFTAKLTPEERAQRKKLFGGWAEGFRPLKPYWLPEIEPPLLEIPVTTIPLIKAPLHLSYLLYLAERSPRLAKLYLEFALGMCRLAGVEPSLLLHPLDFMGSDDDGDLAFFPTMGMRSAEKVRIACELLDQFGRQFRVVTMQEHADLAAERLGTRASSDCSTWNNLQETS